jgi:hypothetical protein
LYRRSPLHLNRLQILSEHPLLDGICSLGDIFSVLGGPRPVFYFGDLDPQGLLIPQVASTRAQVAGLPVIQPHLWSYRHLLERGAGKSQPWQGEPTSPTICNWLEDIAEPAYKLFVSGHRLAQEHIGWGFLKQITEMKQ